MATAMAPGVIPARASTERILIDPVSGIALFGYDPVCYFVDGQPRAGLETHELLWSGATWRFRSKGNLAAFQEAPDVFAPAFGGYAAEHIVDKRAVASDPTIYTIVTDRLYLFRTREGREEFLKDGRRAAAEAVWPAVKARLLP
jgi:hypothetical protein